MGVDPRHADQMVRGTVTLPHGTGKEVKVLVIAQGAKVEEALAAGADHGPQNVRFAVARSPPQRCHERQRRPGEAHPRPRLRLAGRLRHVGGAAGLERQPHAGGGGGEGTRPRPGRARRGGRPLRARSNAGPRPRPRRCDQNQLSTRVFWRSPLTLFVMIL